MDKETLERIDRLEQTIYKLLDELELKTDALHKIYDENLRRLRKQDKSKRVDQG